MRFDISIESIFGSSAKLKILRYLCGHPAAVSESELARLLGISHMSVNRVMRELSEVNAVVRERMGNSSVWRPNRESYTYKALSGIMMKITTNPSPLEHLKKTIIEHLPPNLVKRAVLFGSVAEGTAGHGSDIDLFVMVNSNRDVEALNPQLDRLAALCLKLYGNRLAAYVLTKKGFEQREKRSLSVSIKKGIVLI